MTVVAVLPVTGGLLRPKPETWTLPPCLELRPDGSVADVPAWASFLTERLKTRDMRLEYFEMPQLELPLEEYATAEGDGEERTIDEVILLGTKSGHKLDTAPLLPILRSLLPEHEALGDAEVKTWVLEGTANSYREMWSAARPALERLEQLGPEDTCVLLDPGGLPQLGTATLGQAIALTARQGGPRLLHLAAVEGHDPAPTDLPELVRRVREHLELQAAAAWFADHRDPAAFAEITERWAEVAGPTSKVHIETARDLGHLAIELDAGHLPPLQGAGELPCALDEAQRNRAEAIVAAFRTNSSAASDTAVHQGLMTLELAAARWHLTKGDIVRGMMDLDNALDRLRLVALHELFGSCLRSAAEAVSGGSLHDRTLNAWTECHSNPKVHGLRTDAVKANELTLPAAVGLFHCASRAGCNRRERKPKCVLRTADPSTEEVRYLGELDHRWVGGKSSKSGFRKLRKRVLHNPPDIERPELMKLLEQRLDKVITGNDRGALDPAALWHALPRVYGVEPVCDEDPVMTLLELAQSLTDRPYATGAEARDAGSV